MDYSKLDQKKLKHAAMYVAYVRFKPKYLPLEKYGDAWVAQLNNDPDWALRNPITVGSIMKVYNTQLDGIMEGKDAI